MNNKLQQQIFKHGLLIWSLAAIFYFFDNLLSFFPSAIKPQLFIDLKLSASGLGSLSSCYLWAYGLMQIPAGILVDKFGPRKMLSIASLFCAIGCFLFSSSELILTAKIGRVFIGIGASFAVVGCSKIASTWFAPNRFALFMGLMITVGMLGPVLGFGPLITKMLDAYGGWREALYVFGMLAITLGGLLWLMVRDVPPNKKNKPSVNTCSIKSINIKQGLIEVIYCKQGWFVSIYAGLMFVPTLAFGGLWAKPFLVEAHGFIPEVAGYLTSQVFIGWVVGGPIYGWVSDYIGRRNPMLYVANIGTLIISAIIIYATGLSAFTIGILMFLLGFFSSGFVVAFAVMKEKNRQEVSGSAIGFINTLNTIFGAFFQYLIGTMLDFTSKDSIIKSSGERVFSLQDYQTALFSILICLIASLILLFFVKETYCTSKHN